MAALDVPRQLGLDEQARLYGEGCLFCQTPREQFLLGPEGGGMLNVECPGCEARYNITSIPGGGFAELIRAPQVAAPAPLAPLGPRSRRSPLAERLARATTASR